MPYTNQWLVALYSDFFDGLSKISEGVPSDEWGQREVAERLLERYHAERCGPATTALYGGVSMPAFEVPLKDLLLFFATGRGEELKVDLHRVERIARGSELFRQLCASCHGTAEAIAGTTPAAIGMAREEQPAMAVSLTLRKLTGQDLDDISEYANSQAPVRLRP
jgi:hypothetical protein